MYGNTYSNVTDEMSRLHLAPSPQQMQQHSPGGGRKMAPVVPPKPKKSSSPYDPQVSLK